jgi:hypothetical protein
MDSVSHSEEFCGDSTPFPIPTMGDQIEGGAVDYRAFCEGDRAAPEKGGGGDKPDLLRCAGELFLIATVLTKDAWPPMSRCVPNSIMYSQFPNHIRERAHRGC